jgi:hypothetical protein
VVSQEHWQAVDFSLFDTNEPLGRLVPFEITLVTSLQPVNFANLFQRYCNIFRETGHFARRLQCNAHYKKLIAAGIIKGHTVLAPPSQFDGADQSQLFDPPVFHFVGTDRPERATFAASS